MSEPYWEPLAGAPGPQGPAGAAGAQGPQGAQGPAGPAGVLISTALGAGTHRIQAGQVVGVTSSGQYTVNFPVAFSNATVYVVCNNLSSGANQIPKIVSVSASSFTVVWSGLGTGDPAHFNWVAVGLA